MKITFIFMIVLLAGALLLLNGCSNNSNITILKDGMTLDESICSSLNDYVYIYQTGCSHCAKVEPRLEQVEQESNITFTRNNLVDPTDRAFLNNLKILPEGTPCVIIHCKVYLGDRYTVDDFKTAVNSG